MCLVGEISVREVSVEEVSIGDASVAEVSPVVVSIRNMSVREMPVGELSGHRGCPLAFHRGTNGDVNRTSRNANELYEYFDNYFFQVNVASGKGIVPNIVS